MDSALRARPAAIIAYPLEVESYDMANVLKEQLTGMVVIVSRKSSYTYANILEARTTAAATKSGGDGASLTLAQPLLKLLRDTTIIFDQLTLALQIIGMALLEECVKNGNRVILMTTFGVTRALLEKANRVFPRGVLMYTQFAEQPMALTFQLDLTKMTVSQDAAYGIIHEKEAAVPAVPIPSHEYSRPYTISHERANVSYPHMVNRCIAKGGYTMSDVAHVCDPLEHAPKIRHLLVQLALGLGERHVIFTNYQEHGGVALLQHEMTRLHIPHVIMPPATAAAQMDVAINSFNALSSGVLITTGDLTTARVAPRNVDHLHMLDANMPAVFRLIHVIYKSRNYEDPPHLTVHFHVCQRADGSDSVDGMVYQRLAADVNARLKVWQQLIMAAIPLVFNGDKLVPLMVR